MLVAHARKFSSLGLLVMIVSPSRTQSVVVAVLLKVRGLYDVAAFVWTLRYRGVEPVREIVPPAILK